MADIIDLSLIAESRKHLAKLLEARGINYFLSKDARRPFQLVGGLLPHFLLRSRPPRIRG